jgi:menaquinone-dependent protoporphyrinogen IX oxidase
MSRTLIAYGTRKGATADTAREIARVLKESFGHQVDVMDVKETRVREDRLKTYDNVVVGSSIMAGRWKPRALRLLKRNDFSDINLALFVSAGGTMEKAAEGKCTTEEARSQAITNYIDKKTARLGLPMCERAAFGGRMIVAGKEQFNNWNRDEIVAWAEQLGLRPTSTDSSPRLQRSIRRLHSGLSPSCAMPLSPS